jgi:O-antigen/teichoic acid export membrane protein
MSSLAIAWRSIAKVQVVLAVPLVAFCVPHAGAILHVLYPAPYEQAGPLLALFLVFNGLVRMAGGGASEAALYVLGRQRWVVAARWVSLLVLGVCDVFLIPAFGAAGALLAVGIAQVGVEFFELALARHLLARAYPVGFVVRVLVAVAPALVLTSLWRPETFLGLIAAGAVFALLFLLCLRLVAPLDAEDQQLLDQVSEPLRTFLRVFASRRRRAPAAAAATMHGDDTHDMAAPLPAPRVSGPSTDDH